MNLVQKAVSNGGKLAPLVVNDFGAMNPSVFIDNDGDILVNIRAVNYSLYHSENQQRFPSRWGPLAYLHPEQDQRLVTENYVVRLNPDLTVRNSAKVIMQELHEPLWEFVGLEDCRLMKWDGRYFLVGCRRDLDTIGTSRMEYSEITIDKENWIVREINRVRIPALDDSSYCEKNWFPILDKPYHFVKWHTPTEIVWANPDEPETKQVSVRESIMTVKDQRGSSQVIRWGNVYISISHEVSLFKNYLAQKDALYRHRLIVWDDQMNLVGVSNEFSFLDFPIEFCVGAAKLGDDLLLSFAVADNAAFILQVPKLVVEDLIKEAL